MSYDSFHFAATSLMDFRFFKEQSESFLLASSILNGLGKVY